jgi:hypothetical protein
MNGRSKNNEMRMYGGGYKISTTSNELEDHSRHSYIT